MSSFINFPSPGGYNPYNGYNQSQYGDSFSSMMHGEEGGFPPPPPPIYNRKFSHNTEDFLTTWRDGDKNRDGKLDFAELNGQSTLYKQQYGAVHRMSQMFGRFMPGMDRIFQPMLDSLNNKIQAANTMQNNFNLFAKQDAKGPSPEVGGPQYVPISPELEDTLCSTISSDDIRSVAEIDGNIDDISIKDLNSGKDVTEPKPLTGENIVAILDTHFTVGTPINNAIRGMYGLLVGMDPESPTAIALEGRIKALAEMTGKGDVLKPLYTSLQIKRIDNTIKALEVVLANTEPNSSSYDALEERIEALKAMQDNLKNGS